VLIVCDSRYVFSLEILAKNNGVYC